RLAENYACMRLELRPVGAPARLPGRVDRDRVVAALVRQHARFGVEQPEARAELRPQRDQAPVVLEQGVGIAALGLDVALAWIDRREPRAAVREAAVPAGVPLHRVAVRVAAGAAVRR